MRKITFNQETIDSIRQFVEIENNTIESACNRFGIKNDTMRRLMFENNIKPGHVPHGPCKSIDDAIVQEVLHLYTSTNIRLQDLCKEVKLENYKVQKILKDNLPEEYINSRKSRLYRDSKLGDKNPMKGKIGPETPNWIGGVVDDGNGYLMVKKPEWYTGRKGSDYVFQHSVVVCEALGLTELPKGFVVHHIDRDKHNNNINNLALVSAGAHTRLHQIESKMCKVQRLSTKE